LLLASCGGSGGGDGGGGTAKINASVGGIWNGTDSDTGLALTGLIDEAGEFHFIRGDGTQYVGTVSSNGSSASASFDGYTKFGSAFPDGSTHGTGSLSGTIVPRASFSGTTQFTTDGGTKSSEALALTFNPLYNNPSSLSTISGNYTDPNTGDVVSVTSAGIVTWQDPATSCVGNGTVSIINASYNAYQVQFDYANCQGQAAALNGVQFSGLATLDTSANPEQIVVGVTGQAAGTTYAVVLSLNRS
jgi:hypothetical protein